MSTPPVDYDQARADFRASVAQKAATLGQLADQDAAQNRARVFGTPTEEQPNTTQPND